MKFSLALASVATLAAAKPIMERAPSAVSVKLNAVGNTKVTATLTNTGLQDLNILNVGTLLDAGPVEKVKVYSAESKVAFSGIRKRVATHILNSEAFTFLPAGQSKVIDLDVASVHDVSTSGIYQILAKGVLPIAATNSTKLGGYVKYTSNTLDLDVDGAEAVKVEKAIKALDKRSAVQSDCSGSELDATTSALDDCSSLAAAAEDAANNGDGAKFTEYFKDESFRGTVASCLSSVVSECSSTSSGSTTSHCTDVFSGCSSNVLAYTVPSEQVVVNCPIYFSDLPHLTGSCHAQDQTTTTLHEMTHAVCGTDDLGYGYDAATALSGNDAVNNADSYALYANAINVGC